MIRIVRLEVNLKDLRIRSIQDSLERIGLEVDYNDLTPF